MNHSEQAYSYVLFPNLKWLNWHRQSGTYGFSYKFEGYGRD